MNITPPSLWYIKLFFLNLILTETEIIIIFLNCFYFVLYSGKKSCFSLYYHNLLNCLLIFFYQSGIIVSIKSKKALFNKLQEEIIEYFSCVRFMGGNNSHPYPMETVSRIRKACISKNVNFVLDYSNTHQIDQVINDNCSEDTT